MCLHCSVRVLDAAPAAAGRNDNPPDSVGGAHQPKDVDHTSVAKRWDKYRHLQNGAKHKCPGPATQLSVSGIGIDACRSSGNSMYRRKSSASGYDAAVTLAEAAATAYAVGAAAQVATMQRSVWYLLLREVLQ